MSRDDFGFLAGLSRGFKNELNNYKAAASLLRSGADKKRILDDIKKEESKRPSVDSFSEAKGFAETLAHGLDTAGEFLGRTGIDIAALGSVVLSRGITAPAVGSRFALGSIAKSLGSAAAKRVAMGTAFAHGMGESAKSNAAHGKEGSLADGLLSGGLNAAATHFLWDKFSAGGFNSLVNKNDTALGRTLGSALNFGAYSAGMEASHAAGRHARGESGTFSEEMLGILQSGAVGTMLGATLAGGGAGLSALYSRFRKPRFGGDGAAAAEAEATAGTPARGENSDSSNLLPAPGQPADVNKTKPPTGGLPPEAEPPPGEPVTPANSSGEPAEGTPAIPRELPPEAEPPPGASGRPEAANSPTEASIEEPGFLKHDTSASLETKKAQVKQIDAYIDELFVLKRKNTRNAEVTAELTGLIANAKHARKNIQASIDAELGVAEPTTGETGEAGTSEQGTGEAGTTEQSTAEQGTTEQGTTEQNTAGQNTATESTDTQTGSKTYHDARGEQKTQLVVLVDASVRDIQNALLRRLFIQNPAQSIALAESGVTQQSTRKELSKAFKESGFSKIAPRGFFNKADMRVLGRVAHSIRNELTKWHEANAAAAGTAAAGNTRTDTDTDTDTDTSTGAATSTADTGTGTTTATEEADAEPEPTRNSRDLNTATETPVTATSLRGKAVLFDAPPENDIKPTHLLSGISEKNRLLNNINDKATADEQGYLNRKRGVETQASYPINKKSGGGYETTPISNMFNDINQKRPINLSLGDYTYNPDDFPGALKAVDAISKDLEKYGYANPRGLAVEEMVANPRMSTYAKNKLLQDGITFYPSEAYSENTLKSGGYTKNNRSQLSEEEGEPATSRPLSTSASGETNAQGERQAIPSQTWSRRRVSDGDAEVRNGDDRTESVHQEQGEQEQQGYQQKSDAETKDGAGSKRSLKEKADEKVKTIRKAFKKEFDNLSSKDKKALGLNTAIKFNNVKIIAKLAKRDLKDKKLRSLKAIFNAALKLLGEGNNLTLNTAMQIITQRFIDSKQRAMNVQSAPAEDTYSSDIRDDLASSFTAAFNAALNARKVVVDGVASQATDSQEGGYSDFFSQSIFEDLHDPVNNPYGEEVEAYDNHAIETEIYDEEGGLVTDPLIKNAAYLNEGLLTRFHHKPHYIKDTQTTVDRAKSNVAETTSFELAKKQWRYLKTVAPTVEFIIQPKENQRIDLNGNNLFDEVSGAPLYNTSYHIVATQREFLSKAEAITEATYLKEIYRTDDFFILPLEKAAQKTGLITREVQEAIDTSTPTGKYAIIRKEQPRAISLMQYTHERTREILALSDKNVESLEGLREGLRYKLNKYLEDLENGVQFNDVAIRKVEEMQEALNDTLAKIKNLIIPFRDPVIGDTRLYLPDITTLGYDIEKRMLAERDQITEKSALVTGLAALHEQGIFELNKIPDSYYVNRGLTKRYDETGEDIPEKTTFKAKTLGERDLDNALGYLLINGINISNDNAVISNLIFNSKTEGIQGSSPLANTAIWLHDMYKKTLIRLNKTTEIYPKTRKEDIKKIKALKEGNKKNSRKTAEQKEKLKKLKENAEKNLAEYETKKANLEREVENLKSSLSPVVRESFDRIEELKERNLDLLADIMHYPNLVSWGEANPTASLSSEAKRKLVKEIAEKRRQVIRNNAAIAKLQKNLDKILKDAATDLSNLDVPAERAKLKRKIAKLKAKIQELRNVDEYAQQTYILDNESIANDETRTKVLSSIELDKRKIRHQIKQLIKEMDDVNKNNNLTRSIRKAETERISTIENELEEAVAKLNGIRTSILERYNRYRKEGTIDPKPVNQANRKKELLIASRNLIERRIAVLKKSIKDTNTEFADDPKDKAEAKAKLREVAEETKKLQAQLDTALRMKEPLDELLESLEGQLEDMEHYESVGQTIEDDDGVVIEDELGKKVHELTTKAFRGVEILKNQIKKLKKTIAGNNKEIENLQNKIEELKAKNKRYGEMLVDFLQPSRKGEAGNVSDPNQAGLKKALAKNEADLKRLDAEILVLEEESANQSQTEEPVEIASTSRAGQEMNIAAQLSRAETELDSISLKELTVRLPNLLEGIGEANVRIGESAQNLHVVKQALKEKALLATEESAKISELLGQIKSLTLNSATHHLTEGMSFMSFLYYLYHKEHPIYTHPPKKPLKDDGSPLTVTLPGGTEPVPVESKQARFPYPGKQMLVAVMKLVNMHAQEMKHRGYPKSVFLREIEKIEEKKVLDRTKGWASDPGDTSEMPTSDGLANDNPYDADGKKEIVREFDYAGMPTKGREKDVTRNRAHPINRNINLHIVSQDFAEDEVQLYHQIANSFNLGAPLYIVTYKDYQVIQRERGFGDQPEIVDFRNGAYIGLGNESYIVLKDSISGTTTETLNRFYSFVHEFGHAVQAPLETLLETIVHGDINAGSTAAEIVQAQFLELKNLLKDSTLGNGLFHIKSTEITPTERSDYVEGIANLIATELYMQFAHAVIPKQALDTVETRREKALDLLDRRFKKVMLQSDSTSKFMAQYRATAMPDIRHLTKTERPLHLDADDEEESLEAIRARSKKISKKIVSAIESVYKTMDTRLRRISPSIANLLTSRQDGMPSPKNTFRGSKTSDLALDMLVSKNSALAANKLMNTKTNGKSLNDYVDKALGILSPTKTMTAGDVVNQKVALSRLIKGLPPTSEVGRTVEGALRVVNESLKSTNIAGVSIDLTRQLEPLINWKRISINTIPLIKKLAEAKVREGTVIINQAAQDGKLTTQEKNRLLSKISELSQIKSRNLINNLTNISKSKKKYKSEDLPSRRDFMDVDRSSEFSDSVLIDFMMEKGYIDTDMLGTIKYNIDKYVKGNAIAEKFGGYRPIKTASRAAEDIKAIKKSFANNVLDISKGNFNTLIDYAAKVKRGALSGNELAERDLFYISLGNKLPYWLDIADSVVDRDGTVDTSILLEKLGELGYLRDFENNPLSSSVDREYVSIYDPVVNLEDLLTDVELAAGTQERTEAIKLVKGIVLRRPSSFHPVLQSLQSSVLAYVNTLTLVFSTLSSFPEMMAMANRAGSAKDMFKETGETLMNTFKALKPGFRKIAFDDAVNLGLITENIFKKVIDKYIDATDMEKTANNVLTFLFYANAQEAFVELTQAVNLQAAKRLLTTLGERAANGEGFEQADALDKLKKLGITAEEVNTWDGSIQDGFDLGQATTPEAIAQSKIQDCLFRMVEESIIKASPGLKPYWATYSEMAIFWNLKSYLFAHYDRVIAPFYRNTIALLFRGLGGTGGGGGNGGGGAGIGGDEAEPFQYKNLFTLQFAKNAGEATLRLLVFALMYMPLAWLGWMMREMIQYTMFGQKTPSSENTKTQNISEVMERGAMFGALGSMTHHLTTGHSPQLERVAGAMSPTLGKVARLVRPHSEKLESFSGKENAMDVNTKMKVMSLIPIVAQLPGYKMKVASETTQEALAETRANQRRSRDTYGR